MQPGDAVFLLDVDHFKTVNDGLGHQAGDQVLTELGQYLRNFTRPTDFVARYGGEEFLLICRGVDLDKSGDVANRLLEGWQRRRPLVTFSIGYTVRAVDEPAERTIEHADKALYQAKRDGRNRACLYTPTAMNHQWQGVSTTSI